jgi:hypothetical protein
MNYHAEKMKYPHRTSCTGFFFNADKKVSVPGIGGYDAA